MPQCEVLEKSFPHDIPSLRRNAHAYLHAAPIVAKLYPRAQYFLDRERNAYDIMYKLVQPQYHHFLQGIHSRDLTRLESGEEHTDVRTKLDTTQTKKPHRAGKLHTAIEKVNVESSLPKVPRAPREKRRVPSRSKGLSHLEDQSHRNSERMVHRSHSSLLQHPVEGEKRSSSRAESVRFGVPLPPPVIPHVPRGLGAPLSRPDSDLVAKVTTQQTYDWLLKVRTIPCERIPEAETVSHWASWDVGQHWKRGVINKEKSMLKTHSNEYPQSSKNGVRLEVHHNKRVNQVASEKKDLLMNNPAAGVDVCRQIAGGKLSIQDPYRTRVRQRCIESTYMDAMKSMSLFLRK